MCCIYCKNYKFDEVKKSHNCKKENNYLMNRWWKENGTKTNNLNLIKLKCLDELENVKFYKKFKLIKV